MIEPAFQCAADAAAGQLPYIAELFAEKGAVHACGAKLILHHRKADALPLQPLTIAGNKGCFSRTQKAGDQINSNHGLFLVHAVILYVLDDAVVIVRMARLILRENKLLTPCGTFHGQVNKSHHTVNIKLADRLDEGIGAHLGIGGLFLITGIDQFARNAGQNGVYGNTVSFLMVQRGNNSFSRIHKMFLFSCGFHCHRTISPEKGQQ